MDNYSKNKLHDPIKDLTVTQKNTTENLDELEIKRQKRSFSEENWLYWIRIGFMLLASCLSIVIIFTLFWHILVPREWRWLEENDIMLIKDIAITIIVGILLSLGTTYLIRKK